MGIRVTGFQSQPSIRLDLIVGTRNQAHQIIARVLRACDLIPTSMAKIAVLAPKTTQLRALRYPIIPDGSVRRITKEEHGPRRPAGGADAAAESGGVCRAAAFFGGRETSAAD